MILEFQISKNKIVPHAQYYLNDNQLINALPIDGNLITSIEVEGFETMRWGQLCDLNFITYPKNTPSV
jgi:hypothetical protein